MDGCVSTAKMINMAKVWLGFASVCVLIDVLVSQGMTDVENQFIRDTTSRFSQLSREDMLTAWHTECHRRCRHQLTWTIDLSCRFDPYRMEYRRKRAIEKPSFEKIIRDVEATETGPRNETTDLNPTFPNDLPQFMTRNAASSFLNSRRSRREKRNAGIMQECCINKACSWEEYGEYCQRHPRSRRERDSVCTYN